MIHRLGQMFSVGVISVAVLVCGCAKSKFEYPKAADGFPFHAAWRKDVPPSELGGSELMSMVMIKKWNEGDHDFVGATCGSDKMVHLNYPDVIHIRWTKGEKPDGTTYWYPGKWRSGGINPNQFDFRNGIFPPGVKIADYDSDTIDPYAYLGIERPKRKKVEEKPKPIEETYYPFPFIPSNLVAPP